MQYMKGVTLSTVTSNGALTNKEGGFRKGPSESFELGPELGLWTRRPQSVGYLSPG